MSEPAKSNVPAVQQNSSVVIPTISPELSELLGDTLGAGLSPNTDDRGTPLLYIAQKMSPQVDKNRPEYVPGLEAGMAFTNLTSQHWPNSEREGVEFYPCYFRSNWVEWTPRDSGGGFHGIHSYMAAPDIAKKFGGKLTDRRDIIKLEENDHELILTHYYYGIAITPQHMTLNMIIPMSSTNLRCSQQMQATIANTLVKVDGKIKPLPAFILPWRLRTVYQQNEKGTWYRWNPIRLGDPQNPKDYTNPEILIMCVAFAKSAAANEVEMSAPISERDDEIPF